VAHLRWIAELARWLPTTDRQATHRPLPCSRYFVEHISFNFASFIFSIVRTRLRRKIPTVIRRPIAGRAFTVQLDPDNCVGIDTDRPKFDPNHKLGKLRDLPRKENHRRECRGLSSRGTSMIFFARKAVQTRRPSASRIFSGHCCFPLPVLPALLLLLFVSLPVERHPQDIDPTLLFGVIVLGWHDAHHGFGFESLLDHWLAH
jgi:hypothetical protein